MDEAKNKDTLLAHLGRDSERFDGAVNPPVYHASTILSPNLEHYDKPGRRFDIDKVFYGRMGTPTTRALERAVAQLEGGAESIVVPSGVAAVTIAIMAFVEAGDHILVSDSVYIPTRTFCKGTLARMGVETSYYDPSISEGIADLFRDNTRLILLESPGSYSFEVQDLPAISKLAHERGISVLYDSTWSALLYCQPFALGADVSIQSATKYISGHADLLLGIITSTSEVAERVRQTAYEFGQCAGPDDIYLALRGLRTLAVRLERHQKSALQIATWLAERPEVHRVLHPALPSCPGHEIWRRDFSGATGLFGVVLAHDYPREALAAMIDGLRYFGIGASWGGYESLITVSYPGRVRTASRWDVPGPTLRLHIGLEAVEDLIGDLEAGFERLHQTASQGT